MSRCRAGWSLGEVGGSEKVLIAPQLVEVNSTSLADGTQCSSGQDTLDTQRSHCMACPSRTLFTSPVARPACGPGRHRRHGRREELL